MMMIMIMMMMIMMIMIMIMIMMIMMTLRPCRQLKQTLTHPRFELTEDEAEADVLWVTSHVKDFDLWAHTHPGKVLNQFPNEKYLTCKVRGAGGNPSHAWVF
jgi:hypothetical protein